MFTRWSRGLVKQRHLVKLQTSPILQIDAKLRRPGRRHWAGCVCSLRRLLYRKGSLVYCYLQSSPHKLVLDAPRKKSGKPKSLLTPVMLAGYHAGPAFKLRNVAWVWAKTKSLWSRGPSAVSLRMLLETACLEFLRSATTGQTST